MFNYDVFAMTPNGAIMSSFDAREEANAFFKWARAQKYAIVVRLMDGDKVVDEKRYDADGPDYAGGLLPSVEGLQTALHYVEVEAGVENELFELRAENARLDAKVAQCREWFSRYKSDIEMAKIGKSAEIMESLQQTRNRVWSLRNAIERLHKDGELEDVVYRNLCSWTDIIHENMSETGMWPDYEILTWEWDKWASK